MTDNEENVKTVCGVLVNIKTAFRFMKGNMFKEICNMCERP